LPTSRFLIDAHVHLTDESGLDSVAEAGVDAVRDAGTTGNADCRFHRTDGCVRVVSACRALYKEGGYGARFGVAVKTRDAIAHEIIKLKNAGAGIIKAMASGMVSLKKPGAITAGGFDAAALAFIVSEAAKLGLGVMAHANGEAAILACAKAGVRSIEHGFFMTERALDLMARKSVYWVPTVGALPRAVASGKASGEAHAFVQELVRSHFSMISHAHAIGVPLALGTDCVLPDSRYREAYDAELAYLERAGIPLDEVMKIACEGGARLLGIET
jgi:imidazolonepropionase-like amidohydrolase